MTRPCRRRPLWAAQSPGKTAVSAVADLLGLHKNEAAGQAMPGKGVCPYCRRYIGRGVALHAKWCARKHEVKK